MAIVTLPLTISTFNYAQYFYIDAGSVASSPAVSLTSLGLYFKTKPKATNNKSGIHNPGATLFIVPLAADGTPDTSKVVLNGIARADWNDIVTSTNATAATRFTFDKPVKVDTNANYAFVVKFDGNEDFILWRSKQGDLLVGSTSAKAGAAGQFVGNLYEYISGAGSQWKPLAGIDLKFDVYCAKYVADSYANVTVTNTATGQSYTQVVGRRSHILPKKPYEFLIYDRRYSTNLQNVMGGERAWQNGCIQATTVATRTDSVNVTSTAANFTSIFGGSGNNHVLLISGTNTCLRRVVSVPSQGTITLDEAPTFTNSAAKFSKVAVGSVVLSERITDQLGDQDILILDNSNANSSLKFVNNQIESYVIANSGTGYQNTDYLVVYGGGANNTNAAVNAVANITTDATGNIVSLNFTNKGIGFVDENPAWLIANSAGGAANSRPAVTTDANLSFEIGSYVHTELSGAVFANTLVVDVGAHRLMATAAFMDVPAGTSAELRFRNTRESQGDSVIDVVVVKAGTGYANGEQVTFTGGNGSGAAGRIKTDNAGKIVDIVMTDTGSGYTDIPDVGVTTVGGSDATLAALIGSSRYMQAQTAIYESNHIDFYSPQSVVGDNDAIPVFLSRSHEVALANVDYTTNTGITSNTNVSTIVEMVLESNNLFIVPDMGTNRIDLGVERYVINNDYTNEHLGTGYALSKHISKKMSFANNFTAEDILVYLKLYRPPLTDVKVYARIHNAKDSEAFEDKNWTLLECKDGIGPYSSATDEGDLVELSYGFAQYPNTDITLAGSVTTELSNTTVIGNATDFTTDLDEGDLVKIYSPLFANVYHIGVVSAINNATSLDLVTAPTNNSIIGTGFKIDRIGYEQQAFINRENMNVVRYYDTQKAEYDGYNTFAVKIVLLSEVSSIVPKIDNIKAIGISA